MMNWLKLTSINDDLVLINLNKVTTFETNTLQGNTVVKVIFEDSSQTDIVKESCEEILQMICNLRKYS